MGSPAEVEAWSRLSTLGQQQSLHPRFSAFPGPPQRRRAAHSSPSPSLPVTAAPRRTRRTLSEPLSRLPPGSALRDWTFRPLRELERKRNRECRVWSGWHAMAYASSPATSRCRTCLVSHRCKGGARREPSKLVLLSQHGLLRCERRRWTVSTHAHDSRHSRRNQRCSKRPLPRETRVKRERGLLRRTLHARSAAHPAAGPQPSAAAASRRHPHLRERMRRVRGTQRDELWRQ